MQRDALTVPAFSLERLRSQIELDAEARLGASDHRAKCLNCADREQGYEYECILLAMTDDEYAADTWILQQIAPIDPRLVGRTPSGIMYIRSEFPATARLKVVSENAAMRVE
jgi:hypothetical protein